MKAKLIRPRDGLPTGYILQNDFLKFGAVRYQSGKDVRLLDVQPHLWDSHDDVISGCYWADRLLCNDFPKRVYLNHFTGQYAIRALNFPDADVTMHEAAEEDYFTRKYDGYWQVAAMWRPKPTGTHSIGGKWDFVIDADSKYELTTEEGYELIQWDFDHLLKDLLIMDKINSYITPDDVTAILYKPETQDTSAWTEQIDLSNPVSKKAWWVFNDGEKLGYKHWADMPDSFERHHPAQQGDMVGYKEVWVTDSSRPYDIQNTYWRIK